MTNVLDQTLAMSIPSHSIDGVRFMTRDGVTMECEQMIFVPSERVHVGQNGSFLDRSQEPINSWNNHPMESIASSEAWTLYNKQHENFDDDECDAFVDKVRKETDLPVQVPRDDLIKMRAIKSNIDNLQSQIRTFKKELKQVAQGWFLK